MRRTLGFGLLALDLALLLAARGGGGGSSGGGGGTTGTVNTPGGSVSVSFQGRLIVQSVTPPPGMEAPYGAIAFAATVSQAGGSLTVTLTFPNPIPEGAALGKLVSGDWQTLADANLNFGGTTATYTVQDGSTLDGDGQADGRVVDPVALLVPSGGAPSGANWITHHASVYTITYWGGLFVAVGQIGYILTSPDGINWTVQRGGGYAHLSSVVYGNGRFVVVGWSSAVLISP
ncbi:choice-of-anchor U domain-containing protein [Thermus sp.]|uniref:choice-of-anchor U domain-containing protein n=1 Tax=Thermus sp. TaxID=275 RepID=UPI00307CFE08